MDQEAVNLAKSIRQTESGGDFNAKGKSGESGAYQWMPETWKAQAQSVLGDANAPMTPDNQQAVAYMTIKQWKDQGLNPAQIAAKWNSGSETGWENKVGTNAAGAHFDVPKYVKSVTDAYQTIKGGGSVGVDPGNPSSTAGQKYAPQAGQEQGLGDQLNTRAKDFGNAVGTGVQGLQNIIQGDVLGGAGHLVSAGLQGGGSAAGALGDVANAGLELIPGVKAVEGVLGQATGAFMQTDVGRGIAKSMQDFSSNNPELAKDIGGVFNILTALPILKGFALAKNLAWDASSVALKGMAEGSVDKELTGAVGKTVAGRKALSQSPNAVKTLIQERALPEVVDGKYVTKEASHKVDEAITAIEDTELQPTLDAASKFTVKGRLSLAKYEQQALEEAKNSLKDSSPVKEYFKKIRAKYGDYPNLLQLNEAKRLVAKNISEAGFASPTASTDKIVRSALQQSVEDGAKALGLSDVMAINKKMADLIKAQKVLKAIDGKPVKVGLIGTVARESAIGAGEIAGNATGIPYAGALIGRDLGRKLVGKLIDWRGNTLSRTGKGAARTTLGEAKKTGTQALIGAGAQKSAPR